MGAYIYRLKGKNHFSEVTINGQKVRAYDLVYWYKPYYTGLFPSTRDKKINAIRCALHKRLEGMFADTPVDYVRICHESGKSNSYLKWRPGKIDVCDEPNWGGLKYIET